MNPLHIALPIFWVLVIFVVWWAARHDKWVDEQEKKEIERQNDGIHSH